MKLCESARTVAQTLKGAGFECYVVGGTVRDLLLGKQPHDIDFTTDATPTEVLEVFSGIDFKTIPTGLKHGTITIIRDGDAYEITTYRVDGDYSDGRHPDNVEFSRSIAQDLARRDFTINAIAIDPTTNEMVDLYNGAVDLKDGILRAVGDSVARLTEDGLRAFRAARFSATLGFRLDLNLTLAMSLPEVHKIVEKVSKERIRDEILKALASDRPALFITHLHRSGLLELIIPELKGAAGMLQPRPHHLYDVFTHSVETMNQIARLTSDPFLRLVAFLHDIGKPATYNLDPHQPHFYKHDKVGAELAVNILSRLRFTAEQVDLAKNLILNHLDFYDGTWSDTRVKKWINRVAVKRVDPDPAHSGKLLPTETRDVEPQILLQVADLRAHGKKDDEAAVASLLAGRVKEVLEKVEALTVRDLAVNGFDLMNLGFKGEGVGKAQRYLLEKVLENPELNTQEELGRLLEEMLNSV